MLWDWFDSRFSTTYLPTKFDSHRFCLGFMFKSLPQLLAISCVCALGLAEFAGAKSPIRKQHSKLIDGRLSSQYTGRRELTTREDYLRTLTTLPSASSITYNGAYRQMAQAAAQRHRVPVSLFLRLVKQESNWKPRARSHKGAIGLAQLMPATARSLGVNPHDPRQNLEGGARYLAIQYRKFKDWRLALAAYNAGPGAVEKYGGVPPYRETQNYVRKILGR